MALFQKDNGIWYYTFYVGNRRYRKSTSTKSESKARKIESVAFARAQELGPQAVTAKAPRLLDFGEKRFLPWVNEARGLKPRSRRYYLRGWELLRRTPIVNMPIDRISSEIIDRLALSGTKRAQISPSYRNQALRTLARALHLAVEWKVVQQAPRVHLEEETGREELITPEREKLLLRHAGPTLRFVIITVQDTGGRPDEIFRLRVEDIDWEQLQIFNRYGKTKKSKRWLLISDRMVEELKLLVAGRTEGWLFVSDSKCGHLTTVSKMFGIARKRAGLPNSVVLYSARHTFGTDVLEGTKNPAVTMDVMGHTNPKMMMRYQHPEYVQAAREAINRRNLRNGFGPTSGPTHEEGAQASA
jgi:integrase